ncbi:MAG: tetratricopeptide repeat protein [Gammaproteobacteria bacterium]
MFQKNGAPKKRKPTSPTTQELDKKLKLGASNHPSDLTSQEALMLAKLNSSSLSERKKAFSDAKALIAKGSVEAHYVLGLCYEFGYGTEEDFVSAGYTYKDAYVKGHKKALFQTGLLYEKNYNRHRHENESHGDLKRAIQCFQKAREQHNFEASLKLGQYYQNGMGVERSLPEAKKLYQEAADHQIHQALISLGNLSEIEKNPLEAERNYQLAVEKGLPVANIYLGNMYAKGVLVVQDFKKAGVFYKKLLEHDGSTLMQALVELKAQYERREDFEKIIQLYREYEELSGLNNQLGILYELGQHVKQDLKMSLQCYELAADEGNPFAKYNLARLYQYNEYPCNPQKIVSLYQSAARQGFAWASFALALIYEKGLGEMKPNLGESVKYYKEAEERGILPAGKSAQIESQFFDYLQEQAEQSERDLSSSGIFNPSPSLPTPMGSSEQRASFFHLSSQSTTSKNSKTTKEPQSSTLGLT